MEKKDNELSDLTDKLFLVAIPRGELLTTGKSLQRELNNEFQFYKDKVPPLHMTVDHLKIRNQIDYYQAVKIIESICYDVPPFNLEVKGFSFFDPPNASINLNVADNETLISMSHRLHHCLDKHGLSARPYVDNWKFHISLVNMVFSYRTMSLAEFEKAKQFVDNVDLHMTCKVEWLELWKPKYQPWLEIEEFFPLTKVQQREME